MMVGGSAQAAQGVPDPSPTKPGSAIIDTEGGMGNSREMSSAATFIVAMRASGSELRRQHKGRRMWGREGWEAAPLESKHYSGLEAD